MTTHTIPAGFRPADDSGVPVPSQSLLVRLLRDRAVPLTFTEICDAYEIDDKTAKRALSQRMRRMTGRGMLLVDRRDRYTLPEKMDMVIGHVVGHADGFGFVIPESGGDDLFLHPKQMRRVLHRDKVLAVTRRIDSRGRKEGAIVEVLVKEDREIVGHFVREAGVNFVDPDDARYGREIVIPTEATNGAKNGQVVAVKITKHPIEHSHVVGEVIDILGDKLAPGMETDIAVRKHELPHQFSAEVKLQLEDMHDELTSVEVDPERVDLRDLSLVTIDGADARDFDDAVYAEPLKNGGWRLIVAIADVSHYVQPDSALDDEAFKRGTSVYFPNRVIPMLPEELSNGICSLKPDVNRNCMVCDIRFSKTGEINSYEFYPAVMYSHGRLTYHEMASIVIDRDDNARNKRGDLCAHLDHLFDLYQILVAERQKRGTIDFDFPEPLIIFNEDEKIERVDKRERNDAHRLIEECMLAANICAAEFISKRSKDGGIYRVHEGPDAEGLTDLRAFIGGFGLKLGGGNEPGAPDYAAVLSQLESQPDLAPLIQVVLLRSLKQAIYSTEELGHFALNYPNYTHFTSPIRRYPDLVVHRLIRRIVGQKAPAQIGPQGESIAQIAEHCSMTERRADDASRDVVQWLKAEFMQDFIGDVFSGKISGVKEFGIFVQLDDVFVDGLVHVTMMGKDYYRYDPQRFQMTGERTGLRFRLGDTVEVRVMRSDIETGKIDFELVSLAGQKIDAGTPQTEKRSRANKTGGGKKRQQNTGKKARNTTHKTTKAKRNTRSKRRGR